VPVADLDPPSGEGAPEAADLANRVRGAAGDRLVDEQLRILGALGEVDVAHRLLRQSGA
jgi:hypothetical protein